MKSPWKNSWFLRVCGVLMVPLLMSFAAGPAIKPSSHAPQVAPEPEPSDQWRFANVKEWRLTLTMVAHDELEKNSDHTYQHFLVSLGGQLEAKLIRQHVSGETIGFSSEVTQWPSQLTLVSKNYRKYSNPPSEDVWSETNITAAGPVTMTFTLRIDPEQGTFRFAKLGGMFKSAGVDYKASNTQPLHQEMPYPLPFNYATAAGVNQPLPETGMILEGRETFEFPSAPFAKGGDADRNLSTTVQWTLEPWVEDAGHPKIEVPPEWLPEVDANVNIKASWKGTASEIKFTLYDVSNEKGTCINSADTSELPDLSIAEGAGFTVEQVDKNTWTAKAKVAGDNESELPITCHDYGAWGKVKCELKVNGVWQAAKTSGAKDFLSIPKDDNENHIADRWEKDNDVVGLPETWDLAEIPGQSAKGDGLALYEKYRGVMVLENGKHWKRLPPREKVHFVIDPGGLFDCARWFRASGIRAYKLTEDMVGTYRRVDFNAGSAEAGGKYASRLEKRVEFDEYEDSQQYGASEGFGKHWTPKGCDPIEIYPNRIEGMINRVLESMKRALTSPTQDDEDEVQRLAQIAQESGLTIDELKRIVLNFDATAKQQRKDAMVTLTAIHEVGHACGLEGHLVDPKAEKPKEDDDNLRNTSCPMQYLDAVARRRFILFGELGGDGTFCKVPPDNCWHDLNVKN